MSLPEGYTTRFSVNGNHDDYRPARTSWQPISLTGLDETERIVPKRDRPIYPGGRVHLFSGEPKPSRP